MTSDSTYYCAAQLREAGDLDGIRALYASGDDAVQAGVLNALLGEPGENPDMGPGIIGLAVEAASHPSPEVRRWSPDIVQNQDGWGVEVGPAVGTLLTLLGDPDEEVRRMAAFATGNVCKRRFDWAAHLDQLRQLLSDDAQFVPEAAAWALAKLSRAKWDLGPAVPELAALLARPGDHAEPRRKAAAALLHYAKKSSEALQQVQAAVAAAKPDGRKAEVRRFREQLAALDPGGDAAEVPPARRFFARWDGHVDPEDVAEAEDSLRKLAADLEALGTPPDPKAARRAVERCVRRFNRMGGTWIHTIEREDIGDAISGLIEAAGLEWDESWLGDADW